MTAGLGGFALWTAPTARAAQFTVDFAVIDLLHPAKYCGLVRLIDACARRDLALPAPPI
jgi:hypothetical protein